MITEIKGFIQMNGAEICKLYVDTSFQSEGIGNELIEFAVRELYADNLWALEKNVRAISFYQRHGFHLNKPFYYSVIIYIYVFDNIFSFEVIIYQWNNLQLTKGKNFIFEYREKI